MQFTTDLASALGTIAHNLWRQVLQVFLATGSHFSLFSLSAGLVIAALFLARRRPGRGLRPRVLIRALFPRSLWRHPSNRADFGMFLFNGFAGGAMFGGLLLSASLITGAVSGALGAAFGPATPSSLPPLALTAIATGALYLAYEFAYWFDHMLMHRFAFLWPFHAVHHGAERLTPLTNYRVHPVDTILFYNIVALVTGAVGGALTHAFGPGREWNVGGANIFVLVSVFVLLHLQHSHLWIAFPGAWGRVFLEAVWKLLRVLRRVDSYAGCGPVRAVAGWPRSSARRSATRAT